MGMFVHYSQCTVLFQVKYTHWYKGTSNSAAMEAFKNLKKHIINSVITAIDAARG